MVVSIFMLLLLFVAAAGVVVVEGRLQHAACLN
jgi:hypothetical protein